MHSYSDNLGTVYTTFASLLNIYKLQHQHSIRAHTHTSATPHRNRHSVVTGEQQDTSAEIFPHRAVFGFYNFTLTFHIKQPLCTAHNPNPNMSTFNQPFCGRYCTYSPIFMKIRNVFQLGLSCVGGR